MEGQVTKQKLCWNCEARVDYGVENCPSCGVYLSSSQLLEQSTDLNSGYSPPYRVVEQIDRSIPQSPYNFGIPTEEAKQEPVSTATELAAPTFWKPEMTPMSFLLAGSVFLLFGLVLLLFSNGGMLTLKWNGSHWYLYILLSLPLLFFGWRSLDSLQEE